MAKRLSPDSPFLGIDEYTIDDVSAIQAFVSGRDVPAYVAKRVWNYILHTLCRVGDLSYRPGENGRRDTDFAEGRRLVGTQLIKLSKIDISKLRRQHGRASDGHRDTGRDPNRGDSTGDK